MNSDMSTAKVGDKVWSILHGWGEVVVRDTGPYIAPYHGIVVKFMLSGAVDSYDNTGRFMNSVLPDLYWDEVRFKAPSKHERKSIVEKWVAGRIAEDGTGVIVRTIREDFQRLKMFNSEAEALRDVFNTFFVDDEHIAFSVKVEVHLP